VDIPVVRLMRVEMALTDDFGTEGEIESEFGDLVSINPDINTL
jgi:hypothetical protein